MTALGAPLILGMALQGIFCIHASVVAGNGRLMAFVGESGRGKSTLARYLDETSEGQILRVIDDTLPISMAKARSVIAWPHFLQLKLNEEEQPINRVPAEMPIGVLYLLEESRPDQEVRITPLRQKEATLALVQHTVAGRLFGLALLEAHLAFCVGLVELVPIRRLVYPRTLDTLPFVKAALVDEFSA
jgi:energy-coupling factor transporter ATP-binding protein EcfA2